MSSSKRPHLPNRASFTCCCVNVCCVNGIATKKIGVVACASDK